MDAVEPNWAKVRPFVMDSAGQFAPAPPFPFDTAAARPFFREVKEVYEVGRNLTHEQRAIAGFWDCNPYVMNVRGHAMFATKKITPGGHGPTGDRGRRHPGRRVGEHVVRRVRTRSASTVVQHTVSAAPSRQ